MTSLCDSFVWQMLWIWLCAEVLSGSLWPIYDLRLYDESVWQVCVTNVMRLAVCRSPIGVCDQFTFHSRVFYYRNSVLRFDLRDESVWQVCMTNVMNASLWRFCPVGFCVTNLLGIPFLRVYDLHSSWHSVWRFDLCLCDGSLYSVICGSVQMLWMRHWSSRLSALCLVELLTNGPVLLAHLVILPYVNRWYAFEGVV